MQDDFNPNNPGTVDSNIFALPYSEEQSELILIPVPWEATVSYGSGTANGPESILEASKQIDLYHPLVKEIWKYKMCMTSADEKIFEASSAARELSLSVISSWVSGEEPDQKKIDQVNKACEGMIAQVKASAKKYLSKGKVVATVGGDHSTPLGLMQALAEEHDYGILQLDAHCDLRNAYEGFTYSHASIMYNALKEKNILSLTQVGIRDYCEEEMQYIENSKGRVSLFTDRSLRQNIFRGSNWAAEVEKIVATLPQKVFISFDIDGLSPELCPNTGTPVAGGMSFAEMAYLIEAVAQSGKKIIGFDLNEVSPGEDEWDANVGARALFQLCAAVAINRNKK